MTKPDKEFLARGFSTPAREMFDDIEAPGDEPEVWAAETSPTDPEVEESDADYARYQAKLAAERSEEPEFGDEEFAPDGIAPHERNPIGPKGNINALYAAFVAAMAASDGSMAAQLAVENAKGALLADVRNFALRYFCSYYKERSLNNIDGEDCASDVVIKVLRYMNKFRGESQFRTWTFKIIQNTVASAVRKEETRSESDLCDNFPHPELLTNADITTTGRATTPGDPADAVRMQYNGEGDDDGGESYGGAALAPTVLHAVENGVALDITIEDTIGLLKPQDQRVCRLLIEGRKTAEIAKELGLNTKQVYNAVARFREKMTHELHVTSAILHTCRLHPKAVTELQLGQLYVQQADHFRALVGCRCKQSLTDAEAAKLMGEGGVEVLYRLGVDGKPEPLDGDHEIEIKIPNFLWPDEVQEVTPEKARKLIEKGEMVSLYHRVDGELVLVEGVIPADAVYGRVVKGQLSRGRTYTKRVGLELWSAQAVVVPRCGLRATTAPGLVRAFIDGDARAVRDIDESHELSLKTLSELGAGITTIPYGLRQLEAPAGSVAMLLQQEAMLAPSANPRPFSTLRAYYSTPLLHPFDCGAPTKTLPDEDDRWEIMLQKWQTELREIERKSNHPSSRVYVVEPPTGVGAASAVEAAHSNHYPEPSVSSPTGRAAFSQDSRSTNPKHFQAETTPEVVSASLFIPKKDGEILHD